MRRILVCSADRAERGLLNPVMNELRKLDNVNADWCELSSNFETEDNLAILKKRLNLFKPNIVVVPTDRHEMVYIAAFAFHKGYIVAHFHAGNNLTNHPDDINRRAISCFAHILFCNMSMHKENLIRQGEESWRIHVVGSTAFDGVVLDDSITPTEPFDLVILHPNPLSAERTERDLMDILTVINQRSIPIIWIYPNNDSNFEIIESFLNQTEDENIIKYKNLPKNQFSSLLKRCSRAIGNSSAFYYEMPVFDPEHGLGKLIQIGSRNRDLVVPPTVTGGSKRIANLLATITIDEKLRDKKLTL